MCLKHIPSFRPFLPSSPLTPSGRPLYYFPEKMKTACKEFLQLLSSFSSAQFFSFTRRNRGEKRDFPGGPVVKTALPIEGAWEQSLVWELRSHRLQATANFVSPSSIPALGSRPLLGQKGYPSACLGLSAPCAVWVPSSLVSSET